MSDGDAGPELAVLMVLRVQGRATPAAVAAAAALDAAVVADVLAAATARGAVRMVVGGAVALTDAGRDEVTRRLAAEPCDRAALATVHDRFLALDGDLKEAVTAWQLADPASRPAAALAARAAAARDLAAALAAIVPRLRPYADRLEAARRALAAGDARFVASPRVDSLHQVWFELHEDLLATLGRTRSA